MNMRTLLLFFVGLVAFVPHVSFAKEVIQKHSETGEVFYFTQSVVLPQTDQYMSQEIKLPFAYDSFAVENTSGNAVDLVVIMQDGDRKVIHNEDELHQLKSDDQISNLFFERNSNKIRFEVRNRLNHRTEIVFHFFNSKVGQKSFPLVAATTSLKNLRIISRAEWGADEAIRYMDAELAEELDLSSDIQDKCGDLYEKYPSEFTYSKVITETPQGQEYKWPLQYSKSIKKIVIHHTAENEERARERSAFERMRALYAFHTLSRGWGDIGYNYIIGPNGEVFEGRAGGDKVVGGHVLCHNIGTVGISIMGNFEENYPNLKQINATLALTTYLAERHNIDPLKSSTFHGTKEPNILGHRDLKATACPGEHMYQLMSFLRKQVAKLAGTGVSDLIPGSSDYAAEIVSDLENVRLDPHKEKEITYQFKNIGTKEWNKDTWLHVYGNPQDHLEIASQSDTQEYVAADMLETKVQPGGIGTFKVRLMSGVGSPYGEVVNSFEFTPVFNGKYKSENSSIVQVAIVDPSQLNYQLVDITPPKKSLHFGEETTASITIKNTGNVTWFNDGDQPMVLGTARKRDRSSKLHPDGHNRVGQLREDRVAPGETGTFIVKIKAPNRSGRITEFVEPVIEDVGWLGDKGLSYTVDIREPEHKVKMELSEKQITLLPGKKKNLQLNLANLGDIPWEKGKLKFKVQTDKRAEIYMDGGNIPVTSFDLDEDVDPQKTHSMNLQLKIPGLARGFTSITLRPEYEGSKKNLGQSFLRLQIKDPNLLADPEISMKDRIIRVKEGESHQLEVKFKNTGDFSWYNDGEFPTFLEPMLLGKNKAIEIEAPIELKEQLVKPGETGTFLIKMKTKTPGFFRLKFLVALKNMGKVRNYPLKLVVRSLPDKNKIGTYKKVENEVVAEVEVEEKAKTEAKAKVTNKEVAILPSGKQTVRVKLSYDDIQAIIKNTGEFDVADLSNNKLLTIKKGDAFKLSKIGKLVQSYATEDNIEGLRMIPKDPLHDIMIIDSWDHAPAWNPKLNDNMFRGILEVRVIDGDMIFINELPLEDYLKGSAESPNGEPSEKQKALAILIRTYVLFYLDPNNRKFPGQPYDASDDPNVFQKYLGYGYEIRSPRFVEAVRDTRGEVVTYNGELVKTPYFSQSDGRTRSALEVWGWEHTPYLQSVDDPHCAGLTLKGHGVGLSGYGARAMAEEGKTYEEIIEYYYKGVKIQKKN